MEVALISAWCEMRGDFRHFRADRVLDCQPVPQYFVGRGQDLRQQMDSLAR
ncbi:MAG: WYL domain-containing protein [Alphaproteobacteria bacterium]